MMKSTHIINISTPVDVYQPCSSNKSAFDNLYPAILQCFFIILMGYISGRLGKISSSQGKGLGTFISTFALPSLLFKSMVELDFSVVNWRFLVSIFVAKVIVFFVVMVSALVTTRPVNFGKAGLYSIFTTQSNDFAIGYPILQAIYEKCHPDYIKYIYLLAPISLVILNPIGFVLLEIQQWKNSSPSERVGCCRAFVGVVYGVIKNPIVFMTAIGIAGNFVFQQRVPDVLSDILLVLGNSFSATALFYLGLSMVGKVKGQGGINLLTPVLLIAAKTLLLPFIAREMVNLFEAGKADNSTVDLAEYGFLYGTFPATPSVFLFATQYSTATDTIATSMVACTFLSAPLMFVSAQMVTMPVKDTSMYSLLITETSFNISVLGICGCVWVVLVFIVTRRVRSIPHQFTLSLVGAHAMSCLGMILWSKANDVEEYGFLQYLQYILFFTGTLSARCWVAMLSVVLCLLRCRSLCCVLRWRVWFYIYGFGFPTFLTGLLLIVTNGKKPQDFGDPAFQYGTPQLITAVVVLAINIAITIVTLILQTRYDRVSRLNKYEKKLERSSSSEHLLSHDSEQGSGDCQRQEIPTNQKTVSLKSCSDCTGCSPSVARNIEDIVSFGIPPQDGATRRPGVSACHNDTDTDNESGELRGERRGRRVRQSSTCVEENGCSVQQRRECSGMLSTYENLDLSDEDEEATDRRRSDFQITHHLVLVLLLLISMFIGLFLCLWRIFNETMAGIYIEIEFLDSVFNFGQGIIIFGVFGLDSQFVIEPFMRRIRRCLRGSDTVQTSHSLDAESKVLCERFLRHHKHSCQSALASLRMSRQNTYEDAFTGKELVDWLIEVGLASDRSDAVEYARKLSRASILQHVERKHDFHDLKYYYHFTEIQSMEI